MCDKVCSYCKAGLATGMLCKKEYEVVVDAEKKHKEKHAEEDKGLTSSKN